MRSKFLMAGVVATLITFGAAASWAGKAGHGKASSSKDGEVPDTIKNQFKWEENEVGPKDKKIDHAKIAAMQAQARRDEANRKDEPVKAAPKPTAPTSTIPTMDIEKPAPVAAKPTRRPAVAERPRTRDSLDNLLDSEKDTSKSSSSNESALGSLLAVGDDKPASSHATASHSSSAAKPKAAKRTRHGRH
jgi:hypothetical protein